MLKYAGCNRPLHSPSPEIVYHLLIVFYLEGSWLAGRLVPRSRVVYLRRSEDTSGELCSHWGVHCARIPLWEEDSPELAISRRTTTAQGLLIISDTQPSERCLISWSYRLSDVAPVKMSSCCFSAVQSPIQAVLRPAVWLPGVRNLHSHREL